jgi:Zn-dependent protease with chaperone function
LNSAASTPPDRPFEGGAFHPALSGGAGSGVIRLSGADVRFTSEAGEIGLPLAGLQLALGGASDRLIFLTHPSLPQTTVHTADHAILDHPVILGSAELAAQRAKIRTKQHVGSAVWFSLAGALVLAVVALVLSRAWFVKMAAAAVPVSFEISAGDKVFAQMMVGKKVVKNAGVDAQLKQITDPLLAGISDTRYPFTFHVIEDATLNAFALPGGHVVLHSGLLLAADRAEEIAGVLAHEIAHVTGRHSLRNIIGSAGLYLALSAVAGDASGLLAVLADNSAFLLDRKFTRDFEREADHVGWDYLVRAGLDPAGMVSFFERMEREEKQALEKLPLGGGVAQALQIVSTHPATRERIALLEAKLRARGSAPATGKMSLNYSAFKATVRASLHGADAPPPQP